MATLEELRKRMYKPGEHFEERLREPSFERARKGEVPAWETEEPIFKPPRTPRKWLWWVFGGLVLLGLGGTLLFVLLAPSVFFETKAIDIVITGPQEIQSGERISWSVEVTNKNNIAIDSGAIVFNFPQGSMSVSGDSKVITRERRDIGPINPGESIRQTFDAYVFGGRDQKRQISVLTEYRFHGSSATFAKTSDFSFTIVRSPIALSIDMPKDLRIGQHALIKIRYVSQSEQAISDLSVIATLPDGFVLTNTNPEYEKTDNANILLWRVGNIAPSASGVIEIEGNINGSDMDSKSFNAVAGIIARGKKSIDQIFDEVTSAVVLRAPFLDVTMSTPDVVAPGKKTTVTVNWKNNLPVEVRDPILEITPSGDALNYLSLEPKSGSYRGDSMIWNSSTYSPFRIISSGASGIVTFSFSPKSNLARTSDAERPVINFNAVFRPTGNIAGFEGVDVSGASSLQTKVTTKFTFTSQGIYNNSPIPNSGPLPPKIGVETTYTIIWSFANMSNDVQNVVVKASLPPYISFKKNISPTNADIQYDENSGAVIWKVGKVPAGTGFLNPAMQAAFKIGLVPLPVQEGGPAELISESEATGVDSFTNQTFTLKGGVVTTQLKDDPAVGWQQGKIVK